LGLGFARNDSFTEELSRRREGRPNNGLQADAADAARLKPGVGCREDGARRVIVMGLLSGFIAMVVVAPGRRGAGA